MAPIPEVKIRPRFPIELRSKLWLWLNSPRDPNFDDYGPNLAEFYRQLAYRIEREKTFAILFNEEVVGYLAFTPQNPIAGQFHGLVIDPKYRRRGIGLAAARTAIQLLRSQGFEKFTMITFDDNIAIQVLFRHLGFIQEGYIFNATRRNGKPLSMRLLGCLGMEDEG